MKSRGGDIKYKNITNAWLIVGLRPANERRRYKVTPPLID